MPVGDGLEVPGPRIELLEEEGHVSCGSGEKGQQHLLHIVFDGKAKPDCGGKTLLFLISFLMETIKRLLFKFKFALAESFIHV